MEHEEHEKRWGDEYKLNQEKMKTYNKEISRYDKNSKEEMYICSLCRLHGDMSLDDEEQQNVKKGHFKLNSHIDNFSEKIKINKSIEDKFIDKFKLSLKFLFEQLQYHYIYIISKNVCKSLKTL